MYFVYKIINQRNAKFYVGSSTRVRTRFQTHRRELRAGIHHCVPLQRAWRKYGDANFRFEIIAEVETNEEMIALENEWLIAHQGTRHCYNTGTRAGAAFMGRHHTDEAKAAVSVAQQGKRHRLGHQNSPEHRSRISAAMKGKAKSPEHVEKIRQRMIGTSYAKGRIVTEEQRAKMSRPVKEMTSGTTFASIREAAEFYGLGRPNVMRAIRNDAPLKRGPRKGLHFRLI